MTHPKIERAKKHLAELETELDAFLASSPYGVANRLDPDTAEILYYVDRAENVPPLVGAVAADVLQNLRKALDHLACDLVISAGRYPIRNTGFPIFGSLAIYEAQATEKTQGMRRDAVEAITSIRPYKGGNDVLWQLQTLANIDKHRPLKIVGVAYRFDRVTPHVHAYLREVWGNRVGVWPSPESASDLQIEHERRHSPVNVGDVLFAETPNTGADHQRKFSFDITLGEDRFGRSPLLETLTRIADEVRSVISSLEPFLH